MSASVEASNLIKEVGGFGRSELPIKTLIRDAARKLGWNHSRAHDVWYANARRIDAEEMDALRQAARVRNEDEAREEYRGLVAEFQRINDRLDALSAHLGGPKVSALRRKVAPPSAKDRTVD